MKKKRIVSRINYQISDCKIRQAEKNVEITYDNELVCVITNVNDYNEICSLIKCMFQGGLMYAKISSKELNSMYKVTSKSTFTRIVNEVIEVIKSKSNVIEKATKQIKKWYKGLDMIQLTSTSKVKININDLFSYNDPIQCLRFRFK